MQGTPFIAILTALQPHSQRLAVIGPADYLLYRLLYQLR
jgi:hypothetical protein